MKWIRAWRARRAVERDEWRRLALAFEMNCTDPVIRERAEREWAKLLP